MWTTIPKELKQQDSRFIKDNAKTCLYFVREKEYINAGRFGDSAFTHVYGYFDVFNIRSSFVIYAIYEAKDSSRMQSTGFYTNKDYRSYFYKDAK